MAKYFIKLFIIFLVTSFSIVITEAKSMPDKWLKNINNNSKIYATSNGTLWSKSKKDNFIYTFIKKMQDENEQNSEYYFTDGALAFSTNTQYEFIHNNKLIGYSNSDMKFYEYQFDENNVVLRNELTFDEITALFPKREIIKISDFSTSTNSLKIKKGCGTFKILLLNDTDKKFDDYAFSTHNSKYQQYDLRGFLDIKKSGMIQFSNYGENTKSQPWYVLLVR